MKIATASDVQQLLEQRGGDPRRAASSELPNLQKRISGVSDVLRNDLPDHAARRAGAHAARPHNAFVRTTTTGYHGSFDAPIKRNSLNSARVIQYRKRHPNCTATPFYDHDPDATHPDQKHRIVPGGWQAHGVQDWEDAAGCARSSCFMTHRAIFATPGTVRGRCGCVSIAPTMAHHEQVAFRISHQLHHFGMESGL